MSSGEISFSVKAGGGRRVLGRVWEQWVWMSVYNRRRRKSRGEGELRG